MELNIIPLLKMELDSGAMQYQSGEQDDVARQTRSSSFEQAEVSFAKLFQAKASCARRGYSSSENSLTAQATTIGEEEGTPLFGRNWLVHVELARDILKCTYLHECTCTMHAIDASCPQGQRSQTGTIGNRKHC